jgi:hypothetical protein
MCNNVMSVVSFDQKKYDGLSELEGASLKQWLLKECLVEGTGQATVVLVKAVNALLSLDPSFTVVVGPVARLIRRLAARAAGTAVRFSDVHKKLPNRSPIDRSNGEQLLERGFLALGVLGDGSCQFRAVALRLFGDEERHVEVRTTMATALTAELKAFDDSMGCDVEVDPSCWGNEMTLRALSDAYRVRIVTFRDGIDGKLEEASHAHGEGFSKTVHLFLADETHYWSLLPLDADAPLMERPRPVSNPLPARPRQKSKRVEPNAFSPEWKFTSSLLSTKDETVPDALAPGWKFKISLLEQDLQPKTADWRVSV